MYVYPGPDNATTLSAVAAGRSIWLGPGDWHVTQSITFRGSMILEEGAVLRPAAGVTVTFAVGSSIVAGDYACLDTRAGAINLELMTGSASAMWFYGIAPDGKRDLGRQLNAAIAAKKKNIDVPSAPDHRIVSTVDLPHDAVITFAWDYPRHIECATKGKPVFEAVGPKRHFQIRGGIFDGALIDTPSCLLLQSRTQELNQAGQGVHFDTIRATGAWGLAVVINISAEIARHQNCILWNQYGRGDFKWAGAGLGPQNATVILANKDYWGLPYAYNKPSTARASMSAIAFVGGEICGGGDSRTPAPNGDQRACTVLIKGQTEDVLIAPEYFNTHGGRCGILIEPGDGGSPRRLNFAVTGRTETNKGIEWAGVPTILIDGMNQGGMLHDLHIGHLSHFAGSGAPGDTPVIKTENGGSLHMLHWESGFVFGTKTLIDHRTAPARWWKVRNERYDGLNINVGTHPIENCDIHISGTVTAGAPARSNVRSANLNVRAV
jgi:hypothetical protein